MTEKKLSEKKLSQILKEKRAEYKLTYRELADRTEISWGDLWKIETGKTKNPRFKIVMGLCHYFGLDPFDIKI